MKITFIGHATCLIEIAGKRILTDPIWAKRVWFFKRLQKPGLTINQVLPIDLVLLSHAHFDHFDSGTLKKINKDTPVVCAKHLARLLKRRGFKHIYELDWLEQIELLGLKITALPAKHFGGRWQFWDRWLGFCGYMIASAKETVYFAGDTAYFGVFKILAEHFNIDAAILPIGAYQGPGKADFRKVHMDPAQAMNAFLDLKAKFFVPMHYCTYKLSVEPVGEPEAWLRKLSQDRGLSDRVKILRPGEKFML